MANVRMERSGWDSGPFETTAVGRRRRCRSGTHHGIAPHPGEEALGLSAEFLPHAYALYCTQEVFDAHQASIGLTQDYEALQRAMRPPPRRRRDSSNSGGDSGGSDGGESREWCGDGTGGGGDGGGGGD